MSPTTNPAGPRTISQKVWDNHVVHSAPGEPDVLYIDLHLVHEVTSPQAFEGLRMAGRTMRRPELTLATEDHNVPTADIGAPIVDPVSRKQIDTLRSNAKDYGVTAYPMGNKLQGIVHIIGPEQGLTLPGMTIVCGDSHTATHGAFGSLAFGIGTSEVEHVMATQCLSQVRPKTLGINVDGELPAGSTAKDIILAILGRLGTGGGIGYIAEYRGSAIRALSMEGRMTVCNMTIEGGGRAGVAFRGSLLEACRLCRYERELRQREEAVCKYQEADDQDIGGKWHCDTLAGRDPDRDLPAPGTAIPQTHLCVSTVPGCSPVGSLPKHLSLPEPESHPVVRDDRCR